MAPPLTAVSLRWAAKLMFATARPVALPLDQHAPSLAPRPRATVFRTADSASSYGLAAVANCVPRKGNIPMPSGDRTVRGYFGLGDNESIVHVTSDKDFLLHIWARNIETSQGGVQVLTPPSQFRGSGSTGPQDGLVLDVPAQTGMTLGSIGAQGNETIDLSSAFGARVAVFLTVVTAQGATVTMTRE